MATWTLFSKKHIMPDSLCQAAADAFHLQKKEVKFRSDSFKRDDFVKIYIEEYDDGEEVPREFRFCIDAIIGSDLYKPDGFYSKSGLDKDECNIAKKIATFLGEPLIGRIVDYTKNDIYYVKCYPDGREERVEWPDDEE